MRHEPGLKEDAKNLSLVTGSGILASLLTIGLLGAQLQPAPERSIVTYVESVEIDAPPVTVVARAPAPDRLYGTVRTKDGSELKGYIRWDRNEGSWTDLLDASKPRERGGSSISAIRFGHIDRLEVLSRDRARLALKSGANVELEARATDLGSGLRALLVGEGDGEATELAWRDLAEIDFMDPPAAAPPEQRLFGTLTTRSGMQFTGYVTWDVDEIYTTDILDGDDEEGHRRRIGFGDIHAIERHSSWASRVLLHDGTELILEGTNDVDESIGGISVSDAALGQVKLAWDRFASVRFHDAEPSALRTDFDGGAPIRGTVLTVTGEKLSGDIVWDDDEAFTWEMLNGELDDVEFNVEFGQIARIAKSGNGVDVTLRDGRTFRLTDSNDVDDGNRGLRIRTGESTYEVEWSDFAQLRLEG